MELIPPDLFLNTAARWRVCPDTRYPDPHALLLQDGATWTTPLRNTSHFPAGLVRAFDVLPPDKAVWLWPRCGAWHLPGTPAGFHPLASMVAVICDAIGMTEGMGALKFTASERDLVKAIIYVRTSVITHVEDELFLIPEQGDPLVWFDSDENVILQSRDGALLKRLAQPR